MDEVTEGPRSRIETRPRPLLPAPSELIVVERLNTYGAIVLAYSVSDMRSS